MESIKKALSKSKLAHEATGDLELAQPILPRAASVPVWALKRVQLDPAHLEARRVVSFAMEDPSHLTFNLLRTKVYRALKENKWTSVAISSPTPKCGKTMVAANLAFSLARQADCKTVLVDLDFRKPAVGKTLGIVTDQSISQLIEGEADLEKCFAQVSDNLIVGCNNHAVRNSSELTQQRTVSDLLREVTEAFKPKVILLDLPPLLSGDEAIGALPQVDTSLLVVASGLTTPTEVDECVKQMSMTNYLGLVLNKCRDAPIHHYYNGH